MAAREYTSYYSVAFLFLCLKLCSDKCVCRGLVANFVQISKKEGIDLCSLLVGACNCELPIIKGQCLDLPLSP